jgi:quinol-cytochrome oxidoreductase complex cytochrome b subunit
MLPPLLLLFVAIHIIILRIHGVSEPEGFPEGHYAFYPHHFNKVIIATLFLLILMSTLTVIYPPGLGIPANPAVTPAHIKPEWYFFPTYRFLKLVPLNVGIWVTAIFLLCMTFWPFLEPLFSKKEEKKRIIAYSVGSITLVVTLILTIWEMVVL